MVFIISKAGQAMTKCDCIIKVGSGGRCKPQWVSQSPGGVQRAKSLKDFEILHFTVLK